MSNLAKYDNVPPEIVEQGQQAVEKYFRALEMQAVDYLSGSEIAGSDRVK